ncbi:hypothetical protein Elgi_32440 [Paenibacillus elgii]|nr:hypothetical protein Elgi_32440 [Paenibacillus elgii]
MIEKIELQISFEVLLNTFYIEVKPFHEGFPRGAHKPADYRLDSRQEKGDRKQEGRIRPNAEHP